MELYDQRQLTFSEAVTRAFNNYCNFSGRASRSEYWWFVLFNLILSLCIGFLSLFIGENAADVLSGIVSLGLLLPGLGLAVRRLHDIGKAGGWIFIALIPLVGAIILIVWYCKPSEPHDNRFGPVPNMMG